ncbi:hypothetical protein ABRZ81_23485 [Vibrio vulnificus]|uniref:hypothetical protein n=1 Tax=Vibrio vulnificus TaxID=672 RepID=UPI0032EEDA2E
MSEKTPFVVITEHCNKQDKNNVVRDLAYSIYRQQYESLTKDNPSDTNSIGAINKTLLSEGNLVAHVRSAEDLLKRQFKSELEPLQAKATKDSFWLSVASSIVGNVLYSLLLIIVFVIAKDQLGTWLQSLLEQQP